MHQKGTSLDSFFEPVWMVLSVFDSADKQLRYWGIFEYHFIYRPYVLSMLMALPPWFSGQHLCYVSPVFVSQIKNFLEIIY